MSTQRPNVLLITSDQQHYSTLGCVNPRIKTPALDRLAAEGIRFNRAYCNNPTCTPSRATMITGQYPAWHGAWTLGTKLDEAVPTVGEPFAAAGYATHLIGKAHLQPLASQPDQTSLECQPTLRDLDFWRSFHGPWYGFEHVEVARMHANESHAGQHYAIWMEQQGFTDWRHYFASPDPDFKPQHSPVRGPGNYGDMEPASWELPEEFHYTTWTAERTIANIERAVAADRPFFTWASFHDPHPPYTVSEPWASMYDPADMPIGHMAEGELDRMPPPHQMTQDPNPDYGPFHESRGIHGYHSHVHDEAYMRKNMAIYYGMVSFMDQQIGRILDRLDELGVAENTIIVFTTDHGHFLGQHGLVAKGPFHYEDGIKLPFLVRWPDRVPAGRTSDSLQALIDLPSTFLDAAGLDVPGRMQGVSQLPVWTGEAESARDEVIVEMRHEPTTVHLRTYIDDRYKLTVYRDRPWGELFDLAEDPDERHNRFDDPEYVNVKAELLARFINAELRREPTAYQRIAGA